MEIIRLLCIAACFFVSGIYKQEGKTKYSIAMAACGLLWVIITLINTK